MVHITIVMLVYARFALFPLKSGFIYCGRARLYQMHTLRIGALLHFSIKIYQFYIGLFLVNFSLSVCKEPLPVLVNKIQTHAIFSCMFTKTKSNFLFSIKLIPEFYFLKRSRLNRVCLNFCHAFNNPRRLF